MICESTVAVVIPSYKVTDHVLAVISNIGVECDFIYVVDDCCPDNSGKHVETNCLDKRVKVLFNEKNTGVGGAVMRGYQEAINDGADIIVKIDGDGQMDPKLIKRFVMPIINGEADYTKGNRFYDLNHIRRMPMVRLIGNSVLSFMTKLSSGYWNLFDPTNGYTAIHARIARLLPYKKISRRYFFETDMLFRLNLLSAVVIDIPIDAQYGAEKSNLSIHKIALEFLVKHVRNFSKRLFYNYYLRDLSIASLELPFGLSLVLFGLLFGVYSWHESYALGETTASGPIMLAALPIILGIQFILAFLSYDISSVPTRTLHTMLKKYSDD